MPAAEKKLRAKKPAKLSRLSQPAGMSLEDWQIGLRREYAAGVEFKLRNLGREPVFSTFAVENPETGNTYRIAIRGSGPGENRCTCPDFATNTLGTCKHIEFTLRKLNARRTERRLLAEGRQPAASELVLQYGAERVVRFRPGTACPKSLARQAEKYFEDDGALRPAAYHRLEDFLEQARRAGHELHCDDDAQQFVAQVRDAERRRQRLRELFPKGANGPEWNKLLKAKLFPYQRDGILFAVGAGRALLADEMGLGKTIQALGAAELFAREFGVARVLVVCPTSLKHQWEREIAKFTDRTTTVVGGGPKERRAAYATDAFFKIANYDTVHRDLDLIAGWGPDLVVLDEAQRIKNWQTRVAKSVKRIVAPHALVLTGTPLENRLEELVSIVQYVDLHRLGPTFRLLDRHQQRDEGGKVVGYQRLDELAGTLKPVLLRRRKAEVLAQLPPRIEKLLFVPLTDEQRAMHEEQREVVARIVLKWRRTKHLTEADQLRMRIALQRMRMVCDSSYLLDPAEEHGTKADEVVGQLAEMLEDPACKVVVFSQWLKMHELLMRRLKARKLGHVLFSGQLASAERKAAIDDFRDDPRCRVFLATDAGGVGLNLQWATAVVNVDLPWNPAVLEQRIGRVHRMGQTRPVQVVNFVAESSIEHGMLGLLGFKQSMFAGVLDGGAAEVFLGGSKLTKFMESVEQMTDAIPAPAPSDAPDPGEPQAAEAPVAPPSSAATNGSSPAAADLFRMAAAFFQQLAPPGAAPQVSRDPATGGRTLHLPLPDDAALEGAFDLVRNFIKSLRT